MSEKVQSRRFAREIRRICSSSATHQARRNRKGHLIAVTPPNPAKYTSLGTLKQWHWLRSTVFALTYNVL
jgi:hypothetical protein